MKRIHKPFLKGINWLISHLMSLVGFEKCICENATEEYGVPHAEFAIKENTKQENKESTEFSVEPS